jgi:hypothetical protein
MAKTLREIFVEHGYKGQVMVNGHAWSILAATNVGDGFVLLRSVRYQKRTGTSGWRTVKMKRPASLRAAYLPPNSITASN